jgi:hypothetical protein
MFFLYLILLLPNQLLTWDTEMPHFLASSSCAPPHMENSYCLVDTSQPRGLIFVINEKPSWLCQPAKHVHAARNTVYCTYLCRYLYSQIQRNFPDSFLFISEVARYCTVLDVYNVILRSTLYCNRPNFGHFLTLLQIWSQTNFS